MTAKSLKAKLYGRNSLERIIGDYLQMLNKNCLPYKERNEIAMKYIQYQTIYRARYGHEYCPNWEGI